MLIAFAVAFSILSIIISYKFRTDNDSFFIPKILGFYTLSITSVTLNSSYPIPIGFLIAYILADSSHSNKKSKKISAILGLTDYVICVIAYYLF